MMELRALSTRRRQLVEMIAAEKTRLKQTFEPILRAHPPRQPEGDHPAHRRGAHQHDTRRQTQARTPQHRAGLWPHHLRNPAGRSSRTRRKGQQGHRQPRGRRSKRNAQARQTLERKTRLTSNTVAMSATLPVLPERSSWAGTQADRRRTSARLTSCRCLARLPTVRQAPALRPSAAARSRCRRAISRTPCGHRAGDD